MSDNDLTPEEQALVGEPGDLVDEPFVPARHPMTPRDTLAELRDLSEKATPGPWASGGDSLYATPPDGYEAIGDIFENDGRGDANADLAAKAVNILRDPDYTLLSTAEYDRLRGLIRELAEEVHQSGLLADHADPSDKTGWHVHGIETCADALCRAALEAQGGPK